MGNSVNATFRLNLPISDVQITQGFATEAGLVDAVARFLTLTTAGRFTFHAEHEAGFGRPDLLLYDRVSDLTDDLVVLSLISPRFAPLLSQRAASTIHTLVELAIATGTSVSGADPIARELVAYGRLHWTSRARFNILPVSARPFSNVVAVEVKSRDWRRALVQAYRYPKFSAKAWVLLDDNCITAALKE